LPIKPEMPPIATGRRNPSWWRYLLRPAVASALLLVACLWGAAITYLYLYIAESGCEDYGIDCHEADPALALAQVLIAVPGVIALAVASVLLFVRPSERVGKVAMGAVVSAVVSFVAWWTALYVV
jgi:hypothetical protein